MVSSRGVCACICVSVCVQVSWNRCSSNSVHAPISECCLCVLTEDALTIVNPQNTENRRQTSAEIRCYDVPYKSHEDFKSYMFKYEGRDKRFIDPQFHFSHPARLTFRSRAHIAQYLINYISRDTSYGELKRNCQTFCADFSAFIAGKKGMSNTPANECKPLPKACPLPCQHKNESPTLFSITNDCLRYPYE